MRVALVFPAPWDPTFPSYAMALFKASTGKTGHQFVDCDLNVDMYTAASQEDKQLWSAQVAIRWETEREAIIAKFSRHVDAYIGRMIEAKIDLYAFSINIYSRHLAFWMAKRIKERAPRAAVLMGGPQCFPAYSGLEVLEHEGIDAICTGEGDLVWPQLLEHFARTGDLRLDLPGVCYRRPDGSIADNGVPQMVRDLNALPFADYSDLNFKEYGGSGQFSITTSRGCVNTCAFCSERPNFIKYRHRSAESIFAELSQHLGQWRRNPTAPKGGGAHPYVSFNDSLLNGAPQELHRLCDFILASGLQLRWGGMALIRKEMTPDLLGKMRRAGCANLAWGLESGSQQVLDLMRKRFFTMELAKKVIVSAHEAGIAQSVSLIAGFPGETAEMFDETKRFVSDYQKYLVFSVQPMMLPKNSLVHDRYQEFGIAEVGDSIRWHTVDGKNDYGIRLERVEALKQALSGRLITIEK